MTRREVLQRYRLKHKEKLAAVLRIWRVENPDKRRAQAQRSYRTRAAKIAEWARTARGKASRRAAQRRFQPKKRAQTAEYRTRLRAAPWRDAEAISAFYHACPYGYHVDHIIPLRGKLVSGLHVLENLQYLPAIDNIKKGNRYAA